MAPDLTDGELVERARRGDLDAYGDLVRRYQALAIRTAYVAGAAADAEDAAQEGFIKAHAALDRFRQGAPFRPWLLRIVANEAINRGRAAGRRAGVSLELVEARAADPGDSPESQAFAAEDRSALTRALARLRAEDRLMIAYRYFLDLSEAEMAVALGVARGTVKSRLSRALARLREAIGGTASG